MYQYFLLVSDLQGSKTHTFGSDCVLFSKSMYRCVDLKSGGPKTEPTLRTSLCNLSGRDLQVPQLIVALAKAISGTSKWLWLKKLVPFQMEAWEVETWTKTCGISTSCLILSHTQMVNVLLVSLENHQTWSTLKN